MQGNDVSHCRNRRQIKDVFIDFSKNGLGQFDDQPRCGQVFEGIGTIFLFGVDDRHGIGQTMVRFMMIDNNDLHPCVVKKLHFRESIYAAVYRDQQADFFLSGKFGDLLV